MILDPSGEEPAPADPDAGSDEDDARRFPVGILAQNAPQDAASQLVSVYCDGDFDYSVLTKDAGFTTLKVLQAAFEHKAPGIVLRTPASLTPDEPEGDSGVAE